MSNRVKCPGIRFPSMTKDLLIQKNVGDFITQNFTHLIKNKSKIKDIETSIFLKRILNIFNRLLKKIELLLVNLEKQETSNQCKFFLQQLKFFVEHVIKRISTSSEEEQMKKVYYRNIWHANKKAHIDIKDLSALIDTQTLRYRRKLNNARSQCAKKWKRIKKLKRKYEKEIKNTILKSERNQLKANKVSIINRNNLKEAEKEAKNNLQNLCMINSLAEKELAFKRYKMEAQLAGIISKYDSEVGEKQKELDALTEEYRAIDTELINLQNDMEIQLKILNGLIQEKEELMLKTFTEKLEKFVVLRSTKIIQRWWRKIYWRWRTKSAKSKKDKKKKKSGK